MYINDADNTQKYNDEVSATTAIGNRIVDETIDNLKAGESDKSFIKPLSFGTKYEISKVLDEIDAEAIRATTLHGSMKSLHEAKAVIEEEFDEFWDAVKLNPKKMTPDEVAAWSKNIHEELVQIAAMCVKTIVNLNL